MRVARQAVCCALLGAFVISNPQCGAYRAGHAQLAHAYLRDGLYDQALAETRRAIRQDGPDDRLLLIAALARLGLDEVDAALELIGQAIALAPDNDDLYRALRDICEKEEHFAQTEELLAQLRADHGQSASLWATEGWLYAHQERPAAAIEALHQAILLDEQHLFAHIELSRLLIAEERLAEAETALTAAVRIQPDDPQIPQLALDLGDCQLQQGRAEQAARTFDQALKAGVISAVDIALTYYKHKRPDRAIEYYERALAGTPDDPLILNNLAWTYAEEGLRLRYALNLSMRAVKLDAESPVYLDTYAELLHLLGRHAHAVAIMRQALALEPTDGEHRAYFESQMAKFRRALVVRL